METFNTIERVSIIYALHKRSQLQKKKINRKRVHWVHPLNMKRIEEGQFQVTFLTLRQYPKEFFKYFRMSITSFDTLILLVGKYIQKQNTNMRISITPEERLTVTIR
ncbi:uncharacterized protein LOC132934962 [Metopolophium dirhodum]|uniref:uncharacterized protein LOC132934962 n=1 Tax=Metopolophium dirhodum TaxID=44670 RepID=UPI0029902ADF|nr:uncharacterized protein LOC132934962 [Metopolophium dirhodum]